MDVYFPADVQSQPDEVRIALAAEEYLRAHHWEVYREVSLGVGQPRADLVARSGKIVWVVECKANLTLHLLTQAMRWRGRAHRVSIASPHGRHNVNDCMRQVLRAVGIGWFDVLDFKTHAKIGMEVSPDLLRRVSYPWHKRLNEAQKSYCLPGVQSGGWTPFKNTVDTIKRIVAKSPGISLKDLMTQLAGNHHYASDATARQMVPKWINKGVIEGIKMFKENGAWRLYLSSQCLEL